MPGIRGLGVVRDELREPPNRTQPTDETSELQRLAFVRSGHLRRKERYPGPSNSKAFGLQG